MMCSSFIYSCFLVNSTVFLYVNFHFVSFTAGAVRPFCRGINCSACPVGVFSVKKRMQKNFWAEFVVAWRRGIDFAGCKAGTPTRRGPTFVRAKVGKTRSRGTDSPLTNPFLSLAVLDTNLDFSWMKNLNPYCAQIRSQGSLRQHLPPSRSPPPWRGRGRLGK